ncbi:erbin-like isoform X2 [Ctenocephalides felis]|uniref:erbin-like isoform X2 n=1 Tax=Ctenocephalides felis TaxID=7515 RepID=UPI000E6E128E|nr:erbin-like isoform X2 [Ctenocephalides felis]
MENWSTNAIINWNHHGIMELPSELEHYGSSVREMHLQHNRIQTLPPWITYLRNLSALYLDNNNLRDIPEEIGTLSHLTDLNLSSNSLSKLPQEIKSLHSLTNLIITDNNLTNLPDFTQLRSLRRLDVSYNGIKCLPPSVGELRNLEELSVDSNPLFELPPSVFSLPRLRELSANCCDLRCLPALPLAADPLPNIIFKLNPALKHVPLTLEPLFDINPHISTRFWTYDSTEFFHPRQIHVKVVNTENLPEIDVYLYSGIKHVSQYFAPKMPTLFELALRKTHAILSKTSFFLDENENCDDEDYNEFYDSDYDGEGHYYVNGKSFIKMTHEVMHVEELPLHLSSQLKEGPNAVCHNCKIGLFEYGVLCFLNRVERGSKVRG